MERTRRVALEQLVMDFFEDQRLTELVAEGLISSGKYSSMNEAINEAHRRVNGAVEQMVRHLEKTGTLSDFPPKR